MSPAEQTRWILEKCREPIVKWLIATEGKPAPGTYCVALPQGLGAWDAWETVRLRVRVWEWIDAASRLPAARLRGVELPDGSGLLIDGSHVRDPQEPVVCVLKWVRCHDCDQGWAILCLGDMLPLRVQDHCRCM